MQDGHELLIAQCTTSSLEAGNEPLPLSSELNKPFNYLLTAKAIWQPALSVLLVYTITLAIFPGFLAEDVSSERLGSWYPVMLITAFNIADAVGKVLPVQPQIAMQDRRLILMFCVSRILFLPAFYFASRGAGPEIISLLTLFLGLTNGYFTAVSMMLAPQGLQVGSTNLLIAKRLLLAVFQVSRNGMSRLCLSVYACAAGKSSSDVWQHHGVLPGEWLIRWCSSRLSVAFVSLQKFLM